MGALSGSKCYQYIHIITREMKKERSVEYNLIVYMRLKENNKEDFKPNPEIEAIIKKNLDKIDWEKFKEGTTYRERIFMVKSSGEVYNKYWRNREYRPSYTFKNWNLLILDDTEDRIEKNFEHIQWMAKQGRIKVIKY